MAPRAGCRRCFVGGSRSPIVSLAQCPPSQGTSRGLSRFQAAPHAFAPCPLGMSPPAACSTLCVHRLVFQGQRWPFKNTGAAVAAETASPQFCNISAGLWAFPDLAGIKGNCRNRERCGHPLRGGVGKHARHCPAGALRLVWSSQRVRGRRSAGQGDWARP